jgi:hypothetical protein
MRAEVFLPKFIVAEVYFAEVILEFIINFLLAVQIFQTFFFKFHFTSARIRMPN